MFRFLILGMALFSLRLFSFDPASISIFPSSALAAESAAQKIADLIVSNGGKKTVLGLATGSTMIPVYAALKKIVQEQAIDLSEVVTFNLDEYSDILPSHPQSFRSFMFSHLFDDLLYSSDNSLGIRQENIHIPSDATWTEYEGLIAKYGPIDLQLLGIGRNGHIGFAEPGTSIHSRTMVVNLADTSRRDNAHFWNGDLEMVPKKAVTMGIETILEAKEILLIAFGESKASAIAKTLRGSISEQVPATALQTHPNTSFILDEEAASLLKNGYTTRFINARLLLDHEIQEGELWVSKGKIIPPQSQGDLVVDIHGKILAPGFIDIQINGGFGCDFSRNPEKVDLVARELLQFGVTAFLPTVISSSPSQYRSILPKLRPRTFGTKGAAILGVHLEGPFFSSSYAGAHNPQFIVPSFNSAIETTYGDLQGVKLVTLAPEIPGGADLIKLLESRGILVAAGHSAATFDQIRSSTAMGIGLATHLFNAMSPYHHRNPGIVGAALIDPQLPYSLIVDGIHLCPETISLCWRCNPNGLILISDATEALGLPDGSYKLGTLEIELQGDQIYLSGSRTIAGSNLNLNKAVRLLHSIAKCSKVEALEAASLKPAKLIKVHPQKGTLAIGSDADFVVLSDELQVEATYVGGELAWNLNL